jgi:large exoprotein involved in heme utilization and adhesion
VAEMIELTGMGLSDQLTGIAASTNPGATGSAGTVNVTAGSLTILNGADIDDDTFGAANAGRVNVNVSGPIYLDAKGTAFTMTGILSQADPLSSGNAGDVNISAGSLTILNGAVIASGSFGGGSSGIVAVNVSGTAILDNMNTANLFTGINTEAQGVSGNAGNVSVSARQLSIINGAEVASGNTGAGSAGTVEIDVADSLKLDGQAAVSVEASGGDGGSIDISAGNRISLFDSVFSAQASQNGGSVTVLSPGTLILRQSTITAAANGTGGNITIDPALVIAQNSKLAANASLGNGGNITITAGQFLQSNTLFDVSSQFGVIGTIVVNSPDPDIAGSLIPLNAGLVSQGGGLAESCMAMVASDTNSFIQTGMGGLPPQPGGWFVSFEPADDQRKPPPGSDGK